MVVVTGANGFVGNNLVRQLLAAGHEVRCLVRRTSDVRSLAGLAVEIAYGDVRDPASLALAFNGADLVYNLAGIIAIAPGREALMREVNVDGARHVADACLAAGVGRLCHVSSCHALKEPPTDDEVFDERQPFDPEMWMIYGRTKAAGALSVLDAVARRGLDAVVACPTGMIGPHDFKPSDIGGTVIDFARRRLPAITPGGYDFVDVRDVASGLIALAARGRMGEYYLLGNERVQMTSIIDELTAAIGPRSKPRLFSGPLLNVVADASVVLARVSGKPPRITRDSVRTLLSNSNFSHAKASAEIGYTARPLRETIRDTVEWFQSQGIIEKGVAARLS